MYTAGGGGVHCLCACVSERGKQPTVAHRGTQTYAA